MKEREWDIRAWLHPKWLLEEQVVKLGSGCKWLNIMSNRRFLVSAVLHLRATLPWSYSFICALLHKPNILLGIYTYLYMFLTFLNLTQKVSEVGTLTLVIRTYVTTQRRVVIVCANCFNSLLLLLLLLLLHFMLYLWDSYDCHGKQPFCP
jgi:hypothetical protein